MTLIEEKEEQGKLESILKAAQKKFGQFGLAKTTMTDIASELGMGKASLYYYFPTKEKLYEAVVEKEQEDFIQGILNLIKPSSSAVSLLRLYAKKRLALFENFVNLSKINLDALIVCAPCVKRLVKDFAFKETEAIQTIIELGVANGEFEPIDANEQAVFMVELMMGLRMAAKKKKDDMILEKADYAALGKTMNMAMDMFIKNIQKSTSGESK